MQILKILYYYYYSFYKKVDDEPHSMTVFALAVCQSFPCIFAMQIVSAAKFCRIVPTWYGIVIVIAFIGINYFLFIKTGLSKKIVKNAPPMIISNRFSKWFTFMFFILTIAALVSGPILVKSIMEDCRQHCPSWNQRKLKITKEKSPKILKDFQWIGFPNEDPTQVAYLKIFDFLAGSISRQIDKRRKCVATPFLKQSELYDSACQGALWEQHCQPSDLEPDRRRYSDL